MNNYMDIALEEARNAYKAGEVPVGAIIVKDGEIIAKAHNLKEKLNSPLAHAEILAINEACKKFNNWRLTGAEMYVTLEPCPLCASAIAQSRISKVHIGTFNSEMGACGSVLNLLDYDMFNWNVRIKWYYNEECSKLITSFFATTRKKALKGL